MGNAIYDLVIKPILYDSIERTGPPIVAIIYVFTALMTFFLMSSWFSAEDPADMKPGTVTHTIFTINPFPYGSDEDEAEIETCREDKPEEDRFVLSDILFDQYVYEDEAECYELYNRIHDPIDIIKEDSSIRTN